MATDEVMKNYFARFIGHEMVFMVFSSDFHGIFTNLSFIVKREDIKILFTGRYFISFYRFSFVLGPTPFSLLHKYSFQNSNGTL